MAIIKKGFRSVLTAVFAGLAALFAFVLSKPMPERGLETRLETIREQVKRQGKSQQMQGQDRYEMDSKPIQVAQWDNWNNGG